MREIEIKLRVDSLDAVLLKLNEQGCALTKPINQHDRIYSKGGSTKEWEKAEAGHVVMRVRVQDGRGIFNLKQQMTSEDDNIEIETEVRDPEAIHKILGMIGYQPQVEVKKIRQKGKLKNYEICVDTVEKLGNFVELELLTEDDADPDAVREELFKAAENLGLDRKNQETRGYDTQIFQLEHKTT
jgi:adenylate cyclase, class 2